MQKIELYNHSHMCYQNKYTMFKCNPNQKPKQSLSKNNNHNKGFTQENHITILFFIIMYYDVLYCIIVFISKKNTNTNHFSNFLFILSFVYKLRLLTIQNEQKNHQTKHFSVKDTKTKTLSQESCRKHLSKMKRSLHNFLPKRTTTIT